METPKLKITYFNFPGRAEAARLALTLADIPFEDERLTPSQFSALQPKLPYASLPILTVNGEVHAQSVAILRYCGKLANLYPTDPIHAQHVDEVLDVVVEFLTGLEEVAVHPPHEDDDEPDEDDTMHSIRVLKFVNEAVPRLFGGLEKRLKLFGDGPWAVGERLSIADLALFAFLVSIMAGAFDYMTMRPLQAYTRVIGVFEAVRNHPKVMAKNEQMKDKVLASFAERLAEQSRQADNTGNN